MTEENLSKELSTSFLIKLCLSDKLLSMGEIKLLLKFLKSFPKTSANFPTKLI